MVRGMILFISGPTVSINYNIWSISVYMCRYMCSFLNMDSEIPICAAVSWVLVVMEVSSDCSHLVADGKAQKQKGWQSSLMIHQQGPMVCQQPLFLNGRLCQSADKVQQSRTLPQSDSKYLSLLDGFFNLLMYSIKLLLNLLWFNSAASETSILPVLKLFLK